MQLLRVLTAIALLTHFPALAQPSLKVQIIGIGATTCGQFVQQATSNPPSQRLYLAWVQGYLSGLVIGRPAGLDEGIDLNPKSFPLVQQLTFIREFCQRTPDANFADAVEALFAKLRAASSM